MADPVAIVSVAAGSTVALLSPLIAGRLEQQRFAREQEAKRSVQQEERYQQWLNRIGELIEQVAIRLDEAMAEGPSGERARELRRQVGVDNVRLAVNFGPDFLLVQAHAKARSALTDGWYFYSRYEEPLREEEQLTEEHRQEKIRVWQAQVDAASEFIEACAVLNGEMRPHQPSLRAP